MRDGQALKTHAFLGEFDPARKNLVVREHVQHQLIGFVDVGRLTGKRGPAEWPAAFAEQRTNVGRNESRKVVSVFHALLECESADVVAVIEGHRAQFLQREHAFDVLGHRFERTLFVRRRIFLAQLVGLGHVESLRDVPADGIVRAGLIGEQIGNDAAASQFRNHVGAISHQPDRRGFAGAHRIFQDAQRFVEVVDHHVAVTHLDATLDAFGIDVNSKKRGAVQSRRERLGSAHPTHSAGHHQLSGQVAAEMLARRGCKRFVSTLQNSLRADVNPAAGGHLAVHHQAGAVELVEIFPVAPVADQIRICDQHARRISVRAKNPDGLAGLDQQEFRRSRVSGGN